MHLRTAAVVTGARESQPHRIMSQVMSAILTSTGQTVKPPPPALGGGLMNLCSETAIPEVEFDPTVGFSFVGAVVDSRARSPHSHCVMAQVDRNLAASFAGVRTTPCNLSVRYAMDFGTWRSCKRLAPAAITR